ncbi:precorrin-2 dehydrogenase / sirohydrochlorin ferrochelatase [Halorubrum aquaticum]|uniref:precorrin-2 dehydrogenase n=1 Tax=Halorubrum aquaticum TaxID=387340 RepID=A0A1I3BL35_9EURY|nr:NAD(P)-dependent oxidoreductase [Halorubrum aquaticum]SFH62826.1 precorrin-2 dehydrogenase / sirohydrochlorin ferrochelatase [Halorubrum aquaticum]
MIPLYHDLSDETVLVVGGGAVGRRKALNFAEEARVVVVSPAFDDELCEAAAAPSSIELVRALPDTETIPEWIDRVSPALVVAATDDRAVNAAAEAAALEAGLLVNRTDVSGGRDPGSVVVPATVADGPVRVAISTGGRSPALSKTLRERIGSEIEGAGAMAELTGTLREELSEAGVDPSTRREAIRRVVRSEGVWKGLQKGRSKGRNEANNVIEEVVDR